MTRQTSSAEPVSTEDILHGAFEDDEKPSGVQLVAALASFEIPDIPELADAPRRIHEGDEADLRWFLSEPSVARLIASSGMGGALARAEAFGYGALPCRRCGGRWKKKWRKKDGQTVIVDWRDGSGRMPKKKFRGRRQTYAEALARHRYDECKRYGLVLVKSHPADESTRDAVDHAFAVRGETPVTVQELKAAYPALPDDLTKPCDACQGIGVVPRREGRHDVEVTAWPMGSSVRLGGQEGLSADEMTEAIADSVFGVNDGSAYVALVALERYRGVEELLQDVAGLSPLARVAIEAYYRGGGWQALRELTPAWNDPRQQLPAVREALLARQAAELCDHMGQAFNAVAWGAG